MRNLKRALSLALAAVMVIGMMVVGAGAVSYEDFTDKDEIQNKDAVSMVSALGIINGLPGGSYGPTQNIDRASFTKMIALTLNGGTEPLLPGSNKVSYVDTAGTWAQQYIEFCTNLGIVSGDGTTGKFNPTSPVTISQAAKMLLVALGYNAAIEGYVGYDWQVNVDSAANLAHIYDGITGNTSANATRDQAAQMIYNALSATMVKYEYVISGINVSTSQASAKPQITTNGMKTLLEDKFKAIRVTGTVMANDYAGIGRGSVDEGKTYIHVTDQPEDNKYQVKDGTFKVASSADMLGQSVTMFVQTSGSVTDPTKLTVLGGLTLTSDNKVVTLTAKKETTDKIKTYLKDEGLKYDSAAEYYVNFGDKKSASDAKNYKGMEMTFIDNDGDGEIDYILQLVKTFGQVSSYVSTGDGTIYVKNLSASPELKGMIPTKEWSISNKDAIDDVKGFEDVKKDDYVFFYYIDGTPYVEKAEYIDVTVTSKKGGDTVVADGTSYTQSGLVEFVNEDGDKSLYDAITVGDEVRLYLDGGKNVVYTDAVETNDDYVLVIGSDKHETGNFRSTMEVKAVFADGSTSIIDVDVDSVKDVLTDSRVPDGVYTYSKNSKDVYKLTEASETKGITVNENITGVTQGKASIANGVVASGNTVFVVNRGSSYTVYTGINNVPTLKANETDGFKAYAVVKDSMAKVVFVTKGDLGGSNEGVYVLDENPGVTLDKNGDRVYTYEVIYKGEKTTLTGGSKEFPNGTGYYEKVQVNNGEILKVETTTPDNGGLAKKADSNLVQIEGGDPYTFTKDTVFLIVDGTDVSTADYRDIIVAESSLKITDTIVIVDKDSTPDSVADYVFICR